MQINSFTQLSLQIELTHTVMQQSVGRAINQHLTARNWLIGYYINEIAQFVLTISQSPIGKLPLPAEKLLSLGQSSNNQLLLSENEFSNLEISPSKLFSTLSFTHFVELIQFEDNLKRKFYEIECIKGCWSVRELQLQIGSLCYERAGYSQRPDLLMAQTHASAERDSLQLIVKNPYNFQFLGIRDVDVVDEKELETALMNHLQDFILELGYGFCFEARQKKILIDTDYYTVDLVFYHRILHCHVLIELKTEKFNHKHISQLNTYIEYYKHNEMHEGDNDPVGILLVTDKGKALVEYAKGSMDNQLFVSKYILELPSKEKLVDFLKHELK